MGAKRASWDEYFMAIAKQVATRSTCDRKHVGAVIVRDRMIMTTGYNGSIRGLPHCDDVGHLIGDRPSNHDDAVLEQARVDVIGPLAAAGFFDDDGDQVIVFHDLASLAFDNL